MPDIWFRLALLCAGLLVAALGVRWSRLTLILPGAALALFGLGGLALPHDVAWWMANGGFAGIVLLVTLLLMAGFWERWAAITCAALLAAGLGGLLLPGSERGLMDLGTSLTEMRIRSPFWLLLLLGVPLVVRTGWGKLNRFEARPWVAMGLRALGVALLAFALAEPFFSQASRAMTVLFVLDRSRSIPVEMGEDPANPGGKIDLRGKRIMDFVNASVQRRGAGHERDFAGLLVFGRRPRLELPPSDTPRFNLRELPSVEDGNYTDIGAALKLALASFPEGTARRIVLISDGNENLGNAAEQAQLAKTLGVQIDVLPLAAGVRNDSEVLVEMVHAPPVSERGAVVPVKVLVRSHNPNTVIGRLTLRQITDQRDAVKIIARREDVRVHLGPNPFSFDVKTTEEQRSYTYEAEFEPLFTEDAKGVRKRGVAGDRVENNRASTHVVARGQGRILVLENKAGDHDDLVQRLIRAGEKRFKIVAEPVDILENYKERDKLAVFLSNFDCVVLANIPADRISEEHMEVLRSNTHDQGCGLVMIGGNESFGAGGWQNTPVEKALPVDCDIKSLKVQGKGGLVMIMHASEMADGNRWQKIIAKLAVERLGPTDEVGIIDYNFVCQWHVKMQEAGPNRGRILAAIDAMVPGDMPDFDPALQMAHDALMDKKKDFGAKHIIIISDGDPQQTNKGLLKQIKADKITIATVGVATHGAPQDTAMEEIATAMPGERGKKRYYKVTDPKKLPAIYIKETRLVSQAFVHRQPFQPIVRFRTEPIRKLPELPKLGGFVRTTPKPSELVEVPIITPRFAEQEFPILAHWHYGLGKGVAFTSDAGGANPWCREWMDKGTFGPFWEQLLAWSLRPTESGRLQMDAEVANGKIKIVVRAETPDKKPITDLRLEGGLTRPTGRGGEPGEKKEIRFTQKAGGVYEAEVKADEAGSYFIAAQAVRKVKKKGPDGKEIEVEERDGVRAGVTLPYSPEFSELVTNEQLLDNLRDITNGERYYDDAELLDEAASKGVVFREPEKRSRFSLPFHYWLLFLAAGLLLLDVAVRRLAFDANEVSEALGRIWARLRGLPVPPPVKETAARLSARPVGEGVTRRFEGTTEGPLPARPAAAKGGGGVPEAAKPAEPVGDTMDALKRAKKKVWGKDDGPAPG